MNMWMTFYIMTIYIIYLVAILPDILRSSDPMALVIDDTNSGTIRHLSILQENNH